MENTGAEKYQWDLSVFYTGIADPNIDNDLKKLTEIAAQFKSDYYGRLHEALGAALQGYSNIMILEYKILTYLFLLNSLDLGNDAVKARQADAEKIISNLQGEYLTFFEIELLNLDLHILDALYEKDPIVKRHKPWVEYARLFKPHILTEEVESALTKRSSFGSYAWTQFFHEFEADLEFEWKNEKKNLESMLHLLSESKDHDERAHILKVINEGCGGMFAKYSAQNLYMVVGAKAVESKERGYKNPMQVRNMENQIPENVVTALHNAVLKIAGPLTKRFYRLKAAHLGLRTLKWSDRNARMPFVDNTNIPFDQALDLVLEAYKNFSPTLSMLINGFIANKRIDAPNHKGKRGGAFSSSTILQSGPVSFTFMNYFGSNRDVMTLAHELGHSVHSMLAGQEQGVLMSSYPMAYAETASIFGELTAFHFLKKRLAEKGDVKAELAFIMGKIDDTINTVVRQIGFSNFERRLHGMDAAFTSWNEPKKLSVNEINSLWLETLKPLYGEEGEIFTYENTEHLWTYVSHFRSPFYVYSYAFGELLTRSIYAKQEKFGDKFEPLYLDLLKAGMTKNVIELLKPLDLDPTDENFWIDGITMGLGQLLDEAEELSKQIGIIIG